MAKVLLDSNVVIEIVNYRSGYREWFLALLDSHVVACCDITVAEVYAGVRPEEENRTRNFFENLEYLTTNFHSARLAGELKNSYSRQGKSLSLADCLIAAMAITGNYQLATGNLKDFPMPELTFYPLPKTK